jgi:hypothetical protein
MPQGLDELTSRYVDVARTFAWLIGVKTDVGWQVSEAEIREHLQAVLSGIQTDRRATVQMIDTWKAQIAKNETELGGTAWIRFCGRATRLLLASLLWKVNESVSPTEVIGVQLFDENFLTLAHQLKQS